MSRHPEGEKALTNAERQRRWRERHRVKASPEAKLAQRRLRTLRRTVKAAVLNAHMGTATVPEIAKAMKAAFADVVKTGTVSRYKASLGDRLNHLADVCGATLAGDAPPPKPKPGRRPSLLRRALGHDRESEQIDLEEYLDGDGGS